MKAGVTYEQTFLNENDQLGIVDPTLNAPCLNGNAVPVNGFTDPSQCAGAGYQPNIASNPNAPNSALYPLFNNVLLPYDLTRGGILFPFVGHTDVKELAMYVQDNINVRNWSFNLGIRGDLYNGLSVASQAEPRRGNFLQRPEDEYDSPRLLCAHIGDSVQREPGALQHGMRLACPESSSRLLIKHDDAIDTRLSQ